MHPTTYLVGGALSKREDRLQTNDHQEVMKAKKKMLKHNDQ